MKALSILVMCCLCASCEMQPKLDIEIRVPEDQQYYMTMGPSLMGMRRDSDDDDGVLLVWNMSDFWVEKSALVSGGHLSLTIPDEIYEDPVDIVVYKMNHEGEPEEVDKAQFFPNETKRIRITEKKIIIEKK